jgi:hypothetical protein
LQTRPQLAGCAELVKAQQELKSQMLAGTVPGIEVADPR